MEILRWWYQLKGWRRKILTRKGKKPQDKKQIRGSQQCSNAEEQPPPQSNAGLCFSTWLTSTFSQSILRKVRMNILHLSLATYSDLSSTVCLNNKWPLHTLKVCILSWQSFFQHDRRYQVKNHLVTEGYRCFNVAN